MSKPVTVVVAEDQHLLRSSLVSILNHEDGLQVVGEAANGHDAVELVKRTHPDVVLMDIRMPGINGIDATRSIRADEGLAKTHVVILTLFELDDYLQAALRAGASGFLLKDSRPSQLVESVRRAACGERTFAPSVMETFVGAYLEGSPPPLLVPPELTPREAEVLRVVAQGLSNAEIGDQLCISMGTVKTHIGNLLTKLGARDRAQLVIAAYRYGLAGR